MKWRRQIRWGLAMALLALVSCTESTEPVVDEEGPPPPLWGPVRSLDAAATDQPGEILISWLPPSRQSGPPPLQNYELVHSDQPIKVEHFETGSVLQVKHTSEDGLHSERITGLELGTSHYIRVRAVDILDRAGEMSPLVNATPTTFGVLIYLPSQTTLDVDYGDELRFEVRPRPEGPYVVEFELPGDTTATTRIFNWQVREVGTFEVIATTSYLNETRIHTWTVRSSAHNLPSWGPVRSPELTATSGERELVLQWLRPEAQIGLPPVQRYEIVFSQQPISDEAFEGLPKIQVTHVQGRDSYQHRFEDLDPLATYHARIRVIDELGRPGRLSQELSSRTSSRVQLSGTITGLDEEHLRPAPRAGIRVSVLDFETYTDATGRFSFEAFVRPGPIVLQVDHGSSTPISYPITRSLSQESHSDLQNLLIPRSTVTVRIPLATEWEFLHLLRHLSDKYIVDAEVAHWESYPVEVHVPEKILSNGVDYGAAIRLGIQKWNESVGFTVLVESSDEPEVGVVTSYDLRLYGGGLLGSVTILEPAGGKLYATVPLKLSLKLGEWYESQALADRVALHELGHVLYLTHSPSYNHVLSVGVSGSSPNEVHPDEASVLRALIHTPNGTRYSWYHE